MESESRHVKPTGYSHGNCVKCEAHVYLDSLEQGPRIQPDANWINEASRMLDRLDSLEARMLQREAADTSGPWDRMGELDARVERIEKVLRGLLEEWLILAPKSYIEKALHDLAPPSTQEKNDG